MAVFSRYKQVLEADGSPMSVRTALALINQALDEFLAEQEGEYDADRSAACVIRPVCIAAYVIQLVGIWPRKV